MRQNQRPWGILRPIVQKFGHKLAPESHHPRSESDRQPRLTVAIQTSMLTDYGEVRESGLTGVTRNHVCPCGTEGSNPSLSAIFHVRFAHVRFAVFIAKGVFL